MVMSWEEAGLGPGPKPPAVADGAMVATSHPAVTAAALEILRSGGTAVDAVLTAIPLQQVLEPQLSTIAGGFGMLVWDAKLQSGLYLNAGPDRPRGSTLGIGDVPLTSGARIAVPGTVAGLAAAAARLGTRPWSSYFEPAVRAADEGFMIYGQLAAAMAAARAQLVAHPSGEERYAPAGYLPRVGETFRQPRLAASLRRIAEPDGPDWFQRGPFAERFVESVRRSGGVMSAADLADYRPRWDEPLRYRLLDHDLLGTPMPDTGGLSCALALGLLERLDVTARGPWFDSARAVTLVARALAEADALVGRYGADPSAVDVPVDLLLSPGHLDTVADLIRRTTAGRPPLPDDLSGPTTEPAAWPAPPSVGSNQLVVADQHGNWVTVLHTGYGISDFGTGLVVEGVGVNAACDFPGRGEDPGRRIVAPLASTLVLNHNGRPWAALGTPGFPPPCVTLVLMNLLGHGMGIQQAVEAPRITVPADVSWSDPLWRGATIALETRVPAHTLADLAHRGTAVRALGAYHPGTGRVQAVVHDQNHRFVGFADPRSSGLAAGLTRV